MVPRPCTKTQKKKKWNMGKIYQLCMFLGAEVKISRKGQNLVKWGIMTNESVKKYWTKHIKYKKLHKTIPVNIGMVWYGMVCDGHRNHPVALM